MLTNEDTLGPDTSGPSGRPDPTGARRASAALHTVADWIAAHPGRFDRVVFTVFEAADERAYRNALGAAAARPA